MYEIKGQMGEINILGLILYTKDLINAEACHGYQMAGMDRLYCD